VATTEEAGGRERDERMTRERREIDERDTREREMRNGGAAQRGSFAYVVAVAEGGRRWLKVVEGGRRVWWQWVQRRKKRKGIVV